MAQQPALSAPEPDLAVLGRQYRARTLRRRPRATDDAVLRALDRRVFHAAAVRLAASETRLAGLAGAAAADRGAVGDGICHQQRTVLLGAAIHPGAQRAVDPVVGTAVRGAVVADAVRRTADLGPACGHHHLAFGRAHHHPARRHQRALQHPVQQGRRDVRRRALGIRLYSALMPRRPKTHQLSLICFTTGCGALLLLPFSIWEFSTGYTLKFDVLTIATLVYVVIFPSTLAYLFFNRGIALIGPNRAAPFFHLVPVFGSAMAILLLGEQPRLFHLIGYLLVLAGGVSASRQASAPG